MKHYSHPEAWIRRAVSVGLTTGVVVVLIESGTGLLRQRQFGRRNNEIHLADSKRCTTYR
jgi:hypothetical protein